MNRFPAILLLLTTSMPALYAGEPAKAEATAGSPGSTSAAAQPKGLDERSLPLRTALHADPMLAAPLERLVAMYREAGKVDELLAMYRTHLSQYPNDAKATTVLLRLLNALSAPEASNAAKQAAAAFPNDPALRYLLSQSLRNAGENAAAFDALAEAVAKETDTTRKRIWLLELVPQALLLDRREQAEKGLGGLASMAATPAEKLESARTMLKHNFAALALKTLEEAAAMPELPPETGVEIQSAAAQAEARLGKDKEALARLEALLAKLAADYWRRPEIMRQRLALARTGEAREKLLENARKRLQASAQDETAALELAQMLDAFSRKREALAALQEGLGRLPNSAALERAALELYNSLCDLQGREAFLAKRLALQPGRQDLALDHIRTLYLLRRRQDAAAALKPLRDNLEPDARVAFTIDLARFLRRNNLLSDASALLGDTVKLLPARLDLRREQAELLLALGDKAGARALFNSAPGQDFSAGVPLENLLDAVSFMTGQGLLPEARTALEQRLPNSPANLEIRMTLLSILGRLGDNAGGAKLAEESRALADTIARYRLWLEGVVDFYIAFEQGSNFINSEMSRLAAEDQAWNERRCQRFLACLETYARIEQSGDIKPLLQSALEEELPPPLRKELRQRLLNSLLSSPSYQATAEKLLAEALAEDPASAPAYEAQRAIMMHLGGRMDVAITIANKLNISALNDPVQLDRLEQIYTQCNNLPQAVKTLERRLSLDAANRGAWERWIKMLAASGDEERLRLSLRRLLNGVERMNLNSESRALLRVGLYGSYWRSLVEKLQDAQPEEREANLLEGLQLADAASQAAANSSDKLCIIWARAQMLRGLRRKAEMAEAVAELERALTDASQIAKLPGEVAKIEDATESPEQAEDANESCDNGEDEASPQAEGDFSANNAEENIPGIFFPDGITLTLTGLRQMFKEDPQQSKTEPLPAGCGPLPPFRCKWVFNTPTIQEIASVIPFPGGQILISDSPGNLHCLEASGGKALWAKKAEELLAKDESLPTISLAAIMMNRYRGGRQMMPGCAIPTACGEATFALQTGTTVACFAIADGRLLWRAPGFTNNRTAGIIPVKLLCQDGRLLACDLTGGLVSCLDQATGKLLWERRIRGQEIQPQYQEAPEMNAGASLDEGRLLVYGGNSIAALLDAKTGEILWRLDPRRVAAVEISLKEDDPETARQKQSQPQRRSAVPVSLMVANQPSFCGGGRFGGGGTTGIMPNITRLRNYTSYMDEQQRLYLMSQQQIVLVHPAVAWAGNYNNRSGFVKGRNLMLCDQSGFCLINTAVPVNATQFRGQPVFIDPANRRLCLFQGQAGIGLLDLANGSFATSDRMGEMLQSSSQAMRLAFGGVRLYTMDNQGISCFNARTGELIGRDQWPDDSWTPLQANNGRYMSNRFSTGIVFYDNNNGTSAFTPHTSCVIGDTLYAVSGQGRMAAIEGAR